MLSSFAVLLVNEIRTLLRARISLFWIFVFPFFFLAMMLLSYGRHGAFGSVVVEVVDLDKTELSRKYIDDVKATFAASDPIAGTVVVGNGGRSPSTEVVRVTVPQGFAVAVQQGKRVPVTVHYDFAGGISSQVASKVFRPLTINFNAQVSAAPMPVAVQFENSGSRSALEFSLYMLTGILVMSMMTAGMNSTCIAIADMRERNTFKFMSMLPMQPMTYLAAMLLARLVIIFIASFTLLFGARYVFDLAVPIDAWRLLNTAVVLLVGGSMLIAAGMALSSRIRTVATAVFVCNFVYLALLFGSDLTMPLSSLSRQVQSVLVLLPVSQFVSALRATLIDARGLEAVTGPFIALLGWSVAFLAITRLLFFWHKN